MRIDKLGLFESSNPVDRLKQVFPELSSYNFGEEPSCSLDKYDRLLPVVSNQGLGALLGISNPLVDGYGVMLEEVIRRFSKYVPFIDRGHERLPEGFAYCHRIDPRLQNWIATCEEVWDGPVSYKLVSFGSLFNGIPKQKAIPDIQNNAVLPATLVQVLCLFIACEEELSSFLQGGEYRGINRPLLDAYADQAWRSPPLYNNWDWGPRLVLDDILPIFNHPNHIQLLRGLNHPQGRSNKGFQHRPVIIAV